MLTADRVARFIEKFGSLGGSFGGAPFTLLPFQRELLEDIYLLDENGRRLRRLYLLGLPRKNGKSQLGAALAITHLVADTEDPNPLVISAAGDRSQARLVFEEAKRMVQADEDLSRALKVYRNEIINPQNGGRYTAVSADAGLQQGLNPSFVIFDELHVFKNDELLQALTLGSAMRNSPLFVVISTAGFDLDSPLGRMYQRGLRTNGHRLNGVAMPGDVEDPSFGMTWYGPEPGAEVDLYDPEVWERMNPAWDVMPDPEGIMASALKTFHESAFVRYHLNGWTSSENSWLPSGAWDALTTTDKKLEDGDRVVLGFDGAWKGDSTALIAVRIEDLHIEPVKVWEAPPNDPSWLTPIAEVEETIRSACRRFKVREVIADPYRFERSLQILAEEGLPIVEFPTNSVARIVPACQTFYEAVTSEGLSHNGDPVLARHLANAQVKEDHRGVRITKEAPGSPRKIDAAVATVIAFSRAVAYREEPERQAPRFIVI